MNPGCAVNEDGKLIVSSTQYLEIVSDEGIRTRWMYINQVQSVSRYLESHGSVEPEAKTANTVTYGGITYDFSNEGLITPIPEIYTE